MIPRRRSHGGGGDDGAAGGDGADQRTVDERLKDLMQDARSNAGGSPAVRSVRVVESREQAQPEGGAQEVVVAGAAEVLRSGVQLRWQAAPPAGPGDVGRPEHLPGGQQQADGARGHDPGGAQQADHTTQGGSGGDLLGSLAIPAGGLEPLVLRPEGLPPAPQGDPIVLGPGGHQGGVYAGPRGGAENQPGHPPVQVQSGGHQTSPGAALQLHGGQGQFSGQGHRHPSDPSGTRFEALMKELNMVPAINMDHEHFKMLPKELNPQDGISPVVNVGKNLTENLRKVELPKLSPDSTSVDFGDWLAIVGLLMSDLSGTSSQWWSMVLDAAAKTYAAWVSSTPLPRLRLKVLSPPELAKWPRTEQRAVTMLLAAIPEVLRRELISARKLKSTEILFAFFCRFQPGGVHEKTTLLKGHHREPLELQCEHP
eukprot:s898_g17.t1